MYGSESVFNYPGSMTSGVSQTSDSSSASPVSKPYATLGSQDVLSFSGQGKKKPQGVMGAITDFGKGIVKGAYNAVASLFTVQGMAMAVGSLIFVAVAPAVAVPLLATAGVVMGGKQIAEGATTGDWEKAGEGTFTLGATMLGAKFGPKTVKGAGDAEYSFVSTSTKDGVTTASKPTGILGNTWANIKAVFGGKMGKLDKDGNIMTTADGKLVDGKNIYQLTKEKFSKGNEKAAENSANASTASNAVSSRTSSTSTVAPKPKTTSSTVNRSSSSMSMAAPMPKVEVARIQELQSRASGALTAEETLELKALEAKYPHHNAETVKVRRELAELKDLHDAQTKRELDPANRPRLDELRKLYQDQGNALKERRHLDRIQAARTNFEDLKLPEGFEEWTVEHDKGPDAFNHTLDLEEFESLHALRSNPAEEFTAADQTRYSALKQQLELKKNEIDQKWWISKTRDEVKQQKDIKAMLNADEPEVVNPTGWSVADLDRMSAQPKLAVKRLAELQKKDTLTATEKAQVQALEERFPHRSSANMLQRNELSEMERLHQQETKGTIDENAQERLDELRDKYPDQSDALDNQKFIAQIRSMRADFKGADLPQDVRAEWEADYNKGTKAFNYELDIHELEALNELRSNETYQFTEADHTHYNEVRQRVQDLHDAEKPKWFKDGNFDVKRMTDALEPVEVKAPAPESQMSLAKLDRLASKASDVEGQLALLNSEVSRIQELQQRTQPLNKADAADLKALEEKYPHRSAASVQKGRDLREMQRLLEKDAQKSLTEAEEKRFEELQDLYLPETNRAIDTRDIGWIREIRTDFKNAKVPADVRKQWSDSLAQGEEHFNAELDLSEFEKLKFLKGNKTYEFSDADLARYKELETSVKGRLQKLNDDWDPNIFNYDVEAAGEIDRLEALLEPQKTVNPSAQDKMSLEELDFQSFSKPKQQEGPQTEPTAQKKEIKQQASLDGDESDDEFFEFDEEDESVPSAPATGGAKKETVQDKDKKWYSGFSGPHGAGQIFSTTIAGSLTGDEPS